MTTYTVIAKETAEGAIRNLPTIKSKNSYREVIDYEQHKKNLL